MKDIELENHLLWEHRFYWATMWVVGSAFALFFIYGAVDRNMWLWVLAVCLIPVALATNWRAEYHSQKVRLMLWQSYTEAWWLPDHAEASAAVERWSWKIERDQ
jgi:hypothetical protein